MTPKHPVNDVDIVTRGGQLLLPSPMRQAPLPIVRPAPVKPAHTGGSSVGSIPFPKVAPQTTGTTIVRQFTGLSGVDGGIVRQVTGGGLSPTRQRSVSPTKQLSRQHTGGTGHVRPRPKSVIGMRDEGRGMFLVRQMTGGGL